MLKRRKITAKADAIENAIGNMSANQVEERPR
jgi:hypothetical protein